MAKNISDKTKKLILDEISNAYKTLYQTLQIHPEIFDSSELVDFTIRHSVFAPEFSYDPFIDKSLSFSQDEIDNAIANRKNKLDFQNKNENPSPIQKAMWNAIKEQHRNNQSFAWIYDPQKSIIWNASMANAIVTRNTQKRAELVRSLQDQHISMPELRHNFDNAIKNALSKLEYPTNIKLPEPLVIRSLFSPAQSDIIPENDFKRMVRTYINRYNTLRNQNKLETTSVYNLKIIFDTNFNYRYNIKQFVTNHKSRF